MDEDPATTELLRAAASADSSPVIRRAAVRVLAFGRPRDAATAALLAERADADDEEEVRSAAAQALAAARALAALPGRRLTRRTAARNGISAPPRPRSPGADPR
ncbi:HEAT repeat domain-containing protein [Streptomyces griseosporeus]|uniref:HEAT repeat domain-containing protein n=1 Tax=Streptomyces griseosporeus TaxID=1910 RepID=UPI0036F70ED4